MALEIIVWAAKAAAAYKTPFLAAGGFGFLDYATMRLANSGTAREAYKEEVKDSIVGILNAQGVGLAEGTSAPYSADSMEYARAVGVARVYLERQGLIARSPSDRSTLGGIVTRVYRAVVKEERLNSLRPVTKGYLSMFAALAIAVCQTPGEGLMEAASNFPGNAAGLFIGLNAWNLVGKAYTRWKRSRNEKDIDYTLHQLINNTEIITLVSNYKPSETIAHEVTSLTGPAQITSRGQKAAKKAATVVAQSASTVVETVQKAMAFRERAEQRQAEFDRRQQDAIEKMRSRFRGTRS